MAMKTNLAAALATLGEKQNATYQGGMKHARTKPLPPPGLHRCEITEIDGNPYTDKETGQEYLNVEASFRVIDGEAEGFCFSKTFWGNSERDQGALCDLAALATGEVVTDFVSAINGLDASTGAVVNIQIKQYPKKGQPGVFGKAINFVNQA